MVGAQHSAPPTLLMSWCLPLSLAVNSCALRPTWSGVSQCAHPLMLSPCFVLCIAQVSWNECILQGPTRAFVLARVTGTLSHPRYLPRLCSQKSLSLSGGPLSLITPGHIGSSVPISSLMLSTEHPSPLHRPRILLHACNPEVTGGRLQK